MADVQYVTVTLSDGTPVQVVAGTQLHDWYLALATRTSTVSATSPDIDLRTVRPMAWFMTPHGPQSVIEPATIAEFRRRDYAEITAQQAADFFAGAVDIPDVSFVTGQELPAAMAAAADDADSAFGARLRADFVAAVPRPVHLDAYHGFFTEDWTWVTGQGTSGTTLTAPAAAGATTLAVTSGAGLIDGTVLLTDAGTAKQQQYKVTAGGGTTTLTVTPAVVTALASGAAATPLWTDAGHLTNPVGWSALAYWIANFKRADGTFVIEDPGTDPVVFFGNSWMVSALTTPYTNAIRGRFPSATVLMKGISGNNSTQLLARFDADVPSNAAYVIFSEPGPNSNGSSESPATQQANLEALVAKCRAIGAVPIFLGAAPHPQFPAQTKAQAAAWDQAFAVPEQFPASSVSALDRRYLQAAPEVGPPMTFEFRQGGTSVAPLGAANRCQYARVAQGGRITGLQIDVGVQSGNISVAVYRNSGSGSAARPGQRVATSGAVSCPPVGAQTVSLGSAVDVLPGDWLAISADNTTATFRRVLAAGLLAANLFGQQDNAHPAPATAAAVAGGNTVLMVGA